jgi:hypothetical protein
MVLRGDEAICGAALLSGCGMLLNLADKRGPLGNCTVNDRANSVAIGAGEQAIVRSEPSRAVWLRGLFVLQRGCEGCG